MQTIKNLQKRSKIIAILESLAQTPAYGYQLTKRLSKISPSSLYKQLKEFETQSYLARRIIQQGTSPEKHEYTLTKRGEQFLAEEKLAYILDVASALSWCEKTYQELSKLRQSLLGKG